MAGPVTLEQTLSRLAREGELYERLPEGRVRCYACGHRCLILPGQKGICKVRWNEDGRLMVPAGYVAALQLDPIEKKPFFHAYPGARALSFGMLGCDLHCAYCFVGDTPVLTPTGAVPMKAIFDKAAPAVLTSDGEVRFPQRAQVITASGVARGATKTFRHAYRGPLSVIQPMYLPAIRCTPNHRWLATTDPTDGRVEEVRAADLTSNHFLLVPKPSFVGERMALDVAHLLGDVTATFSIPRSLSLQETQAIIQSSESREVASHFLVPVKSVASEPFEGDVYNLEVEEEHSYLAGFFAVKNCQNALTSQALRDPAMGVPPQRVTPHEIVNLALHNRARVLTSTYNEPLITSEWAVEVFKEGKARGLTCSYVSNGNATAEVLDYLRPWVDLYKVDLKSFDDKHYRQLGGVLKTILEGTRMIHARGFWLEIVTLVIPGFNDSDAELRDIAQFLVSISRDIPWHVTAFHQDYKMTDRENTTAKTLIRAAEIGMAEGLRYVYAGNLPGMVGPFENTYCQTCKTVLVQRVGYRILRDLLTPSRGVCPSCSTKIAGVWV